MKTEQKPKSIRAVKRHAAAERRVGRGAKCECGEARPLALTRVGSSVQCGECAAKASGRSPTEKHHPAGRRNSDVTVDVPINDHRVELSESQREWRDTLLRNPDGDPLIAFAACVVGFGDTVIYLIRQLLDRGVDLLVALASFLREKWGALWWRGTVIEPFAPKA